MQKKRFKKILKYLGITTGIIIMIPVIFALLAQTQFLKSKLRNIITDAISSNLNGSLYLGKIDGTFLNGFSIDSLAIYDSSGVFLSSGRIEARYDIIPLFRNKIKVNSVVITRPSVSFTRKYGADWNIAKIIKPSQDTSSGKLNWDIDLSGVEFKDASVRLSDSTSLLAPEHWDMPPEYFEYHNFTINSFNLKLNAAIKDKYISLMILGCSGETQESQFRLVNFKGGITLSEKGVEAKDLLIQTVRSHLEINASLSGINLFGHLNLADFKNYPTRAALSADDIDFHELRSFLPQVNFLNGSAEVTCDIKGLFGDLRIDKLLVSTYGSDMSLTGTVANLHQPDKLFIDVNIDNSTVAPSDAVKLLPPFHIPGFENSGLFSMKTTFTGEPVNFKTRVSLSGPGGNIGLDGEMNLKKTPAEYKFDITTSALDLAKLFNEPKIKSSIFSKTSIAGHGFSTDELAGECTIEIDSSTMNDIPVQNSRLSITAIPDYIEGKASFHSDTTSVYLSARGDFSLQGRPAYSGMIELSSFDIAKIIDDERYQSDLNMKGRIGGTGSSIEKMDAEVSLVLMPSTFHGHQLDSDIVEISLKQRDVTTKQLAIRSPVLDAEFSGLFDLERNIPFLTGRLNNILDAIQEHAQANPVDSESITPPPAKAMEKSEKQNMDFSYKLEIKNLDPISSLLENIPFNAQTSIEGKVEGNGENFSISSKGTFTECYFGTIKGGLLLRDGTLDVKLDSISALNPLEQLLGTVDISINSGLLNTKALSEMRFAADYRRMNSRLMFNFRTDSIYSLRAAGNISVQPHTYVFDLDSLIFSAEGLTWQNDQDVQLRLNTDGLRVMHAVMKRGPESVNLRGSISSVDEFNMIAGVKRFDLRALNKIFKQRTNDIFSGKLTAELALLGSLQSPTFTFQAQCESTYFRETAIGKVDAQIDYSGLIAKINIITKEKESSPIPTLTLQGRLPINLAFSTVTDRFPDLEQSLSLRSEGFNLNLLDPLLSDFDDLTGTVRCDVTLAGTPRVPKLHGNLSIIDSRFLFRPNNITYRLNSTLEPLLDKIILRQFTLQNETDRGPTGVSNFSGSLSIKDYRIDAFNITTNGQILLMTDATRRTMPGMYGVLFGETDSSGLRLTGTLDRPFLSGKLYLREANLTFPPTKEEVNTNSDLSLRYIVVDDTSKIIPQTEKTSRFFSDRDYDTGPVIAEERQSPIIERLRYNLNIETRGPTSLTMIFTPATGEELYAELEGRVNAINDQGTALIYGDIEISPRSYYNFFKRFDAKGKLKFIGQWNNPELDVQATYEGYKTEAAKSSGQDGVVQESQISGESQLPREQKVIVSLQINGTRFEPKLNMSMKIQRKPGEEPVDLATQATGRDIQSDAITFIITGKFRDELTSREQQEFSDVGSATGTSVASSLVSSIFSDVLKREFPWIRRADFSYRGGSFQEGTSVNITATVGKGYLRAGGRILNDIGNMNVSYQLNIGDFLNSASIRNLYLEIQRKVEGDAPEDKKLTNEARLFYRLSF